MLLQQLTAVVVVAVVVAVVVVVAVIVITVPNYCFRMDSLILNAWSFEKLPYPFQV